MTNNGDGSIRLAFCGKMKSGKDTACNHLKAMKGGTTIHMFASGYRFVEWLMLYPLFGYAIDPENKSKFERLMLQWVGHWGRVLFGKNVWLNATLRKIAKTKGNVFVTGVRYPNEVKRLKEINVKSVWVERPEADRLAAGAYNVDHETETALDGYTAFDYKIPNDKDKATFLRRVECYGHIGKLVETIAQGRSPTEPVSTFMDGGGSHGFQTLDDGVNRGWKPDDVVEESPNYAKLAAELLESKSDREIQAVLAACETELSRRGRGHTYFNKYDIESHEIAQEIRRFADLVDYNLQVSDTETALKTVRQTLHSILDNRPIEGENVPATLTREQAVAECQRIAAAVGEEFLVTTATAAEVEEALAYYRNRRLSSFEDARITKAIALLDKEEARRAAWNETRRARAAEAKVEAATLRASAQRAALKGRKTRKAAAKGSRR